MATEPVPTAIANLFPGAACRSGHASGDTFGQPPRAPKLERPIRLLPVAR